MPRLIVTATNQVTDIATGVIFQMSQDSNLTVAGHTRLFTLKPEVALYLWRVLWAEALENVGLPDNAQTSQVEDYLLAESEKTVHDQ